MPEVKCTPANYHLDRLWILRYVCVCETITTVNKRGM